MPTDADLVALPKAHLHLHLTVGMRQTTLLELAAPDVLCLQETKCAGDAFPGEGAEALGYEVAANGDGRWNGVALLSRVGLTDVTRGLRDQPGFPAAECRAIGATCGPVRLW